MLEGVDYPKPWPLFWTAATLAVGYLIAALALRWRGWARGMQIAAPPRADRWRVAGIWVAEVFGQRQLLQLSKLRWAAHSAIFFGFIALALLSAFHVGLQLLAILTRDGATAAWFLHGAGQAALKLWGNVFGSVLLAGLLLALARRVRRRPAAGEPPESDAPLVLFLLWLTLSGFLLEGLRSAAAATPADTAALRPWLTGLWTVHGLSGLALVAWLPRSTLLHGLLAPLVIALNARAEHARKDLYWPGTVRRPEIRSPKA